MDHVENMGSGTFSDFPDFDTFYSLRAKRPIHCP